jgi:hypothetical protein
MKKTINILLFVLVSLFSYSQNVGISANTSFAPTSTLHVDGTVRLGLASSTNASQIWQNSSNANIVTINSGVTSADYSLTLPISQGGAKTYLQNDGTGVLSWRAPKIARDMLINSGTAYSENQTMYCGPGSVDGWLVAGETYCRTPMPACVVTDMKVNVVANGINQPTTFTLRKNGVDQAFVATVPASSTGWYSVSGSIAFTEGDLVNVKIVIPNGAGTPSITIMSVVIFYQSQ